MAVGNDVIDLRDPDTLPGSSHPRFLERVCCDHEVDVIRGSADPNRMLWAHWAAKESAFKALRKVAPEIRYRPAAFAVTFRHGNDGGILHAMVQAANLVAAIEIHNCRHHLHAVARALSPDSNEELVPFWRVMSGVRGLSDANGSSSVAARVLLTHALADHVGLDPSEVNILRADRRGVPPTIVVRGEPATFDASLSHHGALVAFACALPAGLIEA